MLRIATLPSGPRFRTRFCTEARRDLGANDAITNLDEQDPARTATAEHHVPARVTIRVRYHTGVCRTRSLLPGGRQSAGDDPTGPSSVAEARSKWKFARHKGRCPVSEDRLDDNELGEVSRGDVPGSVREKVAT